MKTYPLGDTPTANETGGAHFNDRRVIGSLGIGPRGFRAVATGERRPPKAGEWYLSGAIVTAYKAPNDFTAVHVLAKLVKVIVIPGRYEIIAIQRTEENNS